MTGPAPPDAAAELMARYGIARVPVDQFHFREWRYSNLSDAVAQARRVAAASAPSLQPKDIDHGQKSA